MHSYIFSGEVGHMDAPLTILYSPAALDTMRRRMRHTALYLGVRAGISMIAIGAED